MVITAGLSSPRGITEHVMALCKVASGLSLVLDYHSVSGNQLKSVAETVM